MKLYIYYIFRVINYSDMTKDINNMPLQILS